MFALAALGAAWLPDTALLEANQLHTLYYADANFKIFHDTPPRDGNLTEAPATSIRWELFAKGLADAEYFARLDAIATRALDGCAADAAASRCCREAARSQAVLEAVGKVVWNFSDVPSNIDLTSGGVGKHYHYDEPYSTNTTLMHEVVDGVAAQIEIVAAACA